MVISIHDAKLLEGYQIQLSFSDGLQRVIDFEPFLKNSRNVMTTKFLDQSEFANFYIEHADLIWNDFEMCFPIWDLHEGKI